MGEKVDRCFWWGCLGLFGVVGCWEYFLFGFVVWWSFGGLVVVGGVGGCGRVL